MFASPIKYFYLKFKIITKLNCLAFSKFSAIYKLPMSQPVQHKLKAFLRVYVYKTLVYIKNKNI